MLMLLRQATCYIFVLTEDERTAVHTDSGLRTLEVTGAIISRRRRMKTCLRPIYARLNPDCVANCTEIDHKLRIDPLPQGGIL